MNCLMKVVDEKQPDRKVCERCGRVLILKVPAAEIKAQCGRQVFAGGNQELAPVSFRYPTTSVPEMPSTAKQVFSLAAAATQFAASIWREGKDALTPPDEYRERLEACEGCPMLKLTWLGSRCSVCGCGIHLKARAKTFRCPHPDGDRWPNPPKKLG